MLWIPLTQVQMLKSFNSLLIKFMINVSTQETSCQHFFSSRLYVREFFLDNSLVQEIFSYPYALAGYFFQNHPTPPPSEVKWLAPKMDTVLYGAFILSKFNITNRESTFQNDRHSSNSVNKPFLNRMAFSRSRWVNSIGYFSN